MYFMSSGKAPFHQLGLNPEAGLRLKPGCLKDLQDPTVDFQCRGRQMQDHYPNERQNRQMTFTWTARCAQQTQMMKNLINGHIPAVLVITRTRSVNCRAASCGCCSCYVRSSCCCCCCCCRCYWCCCGVAAMAGSTSPLLQESLFNPYCSPCIPSPILPDALDPKPSTGEPGHPPAV